MTKTSDPPSKVWVFVFALVFALGFGAGGWFAGIAPIAHSLIDYKHMRGWVPVQAEILETDLEVFSGDEGGNTYKVRAKYSYRYGGRDYIGERVGIMDLSADNVGNWHASWHSRLDAAKESGRSVEAWVDPEAPAQSVLDRELRMGMLYFHLVFALLFPPIALFAAYSAWGTLRRPHVGSNAEVIGASGETEEVFAQATEEFFVQDTPIPPEIATIEKGMTQLHIRYGADRHRHPVRFLLTFGAVFAAFGPVFYFVFDAPFVFMLVPSGIGLATLYFGLRLWRQRFEVEIRDGTLSAVKSNVFGSEQAGCFVKEIEVLYPAVSYSSGSEGARQQKFYVLYAGTTGGGQIEIGNGIPSAAIAEALLRQVRTLLRPETKILGEQEGRERAIEAVRSGAVPRPWALRYLRFLPPLIFVLIAGSLFAPMLWDSFGTNAPEAEPPPVAEEAVTWTATDAWLNAVDGNNLDELKRLAAQGFAVDTPGDNGETPLMIAAGLGRVEALRTLIELGADPRARDRFGKTAYDWAVEYKHDAAASELLPYR